MSDVIITAASVQPGANAGTAEGTSGATLTAGQVMYRDTADVHKLKLADANAAFPANEVEGITLHGSLAGQPVEYQHRGDITIGGTLVKGTVYALSRTPGGICPVADLTTGDTVVILGVASSTTVLKLRIENSGVTI